ncbi:MAG: ferredoxin [Actinomycetota bacterium]
MTEKAGMLQVSVDGKRCQGHNRCIALCPDVFEADEYGYSVVKLPEVGPELGEKVRLAEQNCPENAISVT